MSYVDYAGGVEDVLAMCLTGFPSFDQTSAQRRSLIYVGPGSRRAPGETRPVLFTADAVRDLAKAADVQVNIFHRGASTARWTHWPGTPADSHSRGTPSDTHVAEVRNNPPPRGRREGAAVRVRRNAGYPTDFGADRIGGPGVLAAGGAAMTPHPVLPSLLLATVAVLLVTARAVVLSPLAGIGPKPGGVVALARHHLGRTTSTRRGHSRRDRRRPIRHPQCGSRRTECLPARRPLTGHGGPDLDDRTRMDVARDDIAALILRYPQARFAVIDFASAPALDWPLSADTWSLRPAWTPSRPYAYSPDAVTQANAGAANTVLRYQLISAVQQYPRATSSSSISAPVPANHGWRPGNLIRRRNRSTAVRCSATAPRRGTVPDTDIERSSVDDATLRAVADQLAVPFVARSDTAPLAAALPDGGAGQPTARRATAGGDRNVLAASPGRSDPHPDRALLRPARFPSQQARRREGGAMTILHWWRSGPARLRLRRRLLVYSTPVALLLVVAIVKSLPSWLPAIPPSRRIRTGQRRYAGGGSLTVLNVFSRPRRTSPQAASRCSTTVWRRRTAGSAKA